MSTSFLEESRSAFVVLGPGLRRSGPRRSESGGYNWPWLLDLTVPARDNRGGTRATRGDHLNWRFRQQVTLIVQDEMARVLDLHRGGFYALDRVGTRMLFAALERGSEAMVQETARAYGLPDTQVQGDWVALLEGFRKVGLTEANHSRGSGLALPGHLTVWLRLTLARLSFRLLGWEKTLWAWQVVGRARARATLADSESLISAIDGLIRRVAGRHLLNPQCKERALVSWSLLRRSGLPARLVMGIALYPFEAHAWTECAGRVVGDEPGRCEQYTPLAIYE